MSRNEFRRLVDHPKVTNNYMDGIRMQQPKSYMLIIRTSVSCRNREVVDWSSAALHGTRFTDIASMRRQIPNSHSGSGRATVIGGGPRERGCVARTRGQLWRSEGLACRGADVSLRQPAKGCAHQDRRP